MLKFGVLSGYPRRIEEKRQYFYEKEQQMSETGQVRMPQTSDQLEQLAKAVAI